MTLKNEPIKALLIALAVGAALSALVRIFARELRSLIERDATRSNVAARCRRRSRSRLSRDQYAQHQKPGPVTRVARTMPMSQ